MIGPTILITTMIFGTMLGIALFIGFYPFIWLVLLMYFGILIDIVEIQPVQRRHGKNVFEFRRMQNSDLKHYKKICIEENKSLVWWKIEWGILILCYAFMIIFFIKIVGNF